MIRGGFLEPNQMSEVVTKAEREMEMEILLNTAPLPTNHGFQRLLLEWVHNLPL
jgi:3-deoxy-D-manno-octulosonic acid (KDO) 8-phosphate synthase